MMIFDRIYTNNVFIPKELKKKVIILAQGKLIILLILLALKVFYGYKNIKKFH